MGRVRSSLLIACVVSACVPRTRPAETRLVPEPPPPPSGTVPRVVTETDEFRGSTIHKIEGVHLTSDRGRALGVRFLAVPEDPDPWLVVHSTSDDWEYLRCHSVAMILDERRGSLPSDHDGSVGRGVVVESVRVHLTPALLVAMARGSDVRIRVCSDVLVIDTALRSLMLEFAQRVWREEPRQPEQVEPEAAPEESAPVSEDQPASLP